jgi:hypothetical protein
MDDPTLNPAFSKDAGDGFGERFAWSIRRRS